MYYQKKGEISTVLTLFALFTALGGFTLGSFVGSRNSQNTQANTTLKIGAKCVVNRSTCENDLICLPRYTSSDLSKISNPTLKKAAADEGICQKVSENLSTTGTQTSNFTNLADQILTLKNSSASKEIATLLETGQISSGNGSQNSPFQINPPVSTQDEEGKRFVATGGICSANFSFIKDPWVSKISVRKASDDPKNEIYTIDTTSKALDNSLPPESFPRLLNINGSSVRWVWNPKAAELNAPSKPLGANNFLTTSLGGGQSVSHFYGASTEKFQAMTTAGELIVRLFYQTTKDSQADTVYMYQDVKVADCKNGITPTVIPPTTTKTPTSTPTDAPPSITPPFTLTATPSKAISQTLTPTATPSLPGSNLSVTPIIPVSVTPHSNITLAPRLSCNDICNPSSNAPNYGCPSHLRCAPEVGTGIPPLATFRCFLPDLHEVKYKCERPSGTPPPPSPTPTSFVTPSLPLKACYGTINLVVDVTTTNKTNLQNIKDTIVASINSSYQTNPAQTTTYRLFKFSKNLTSFANAKLLTATELKNEIIKNCETDKNAFLCYSPNTDIRTMVSNLSEHYQSSFFVEPYFVFTDGLHYYETDRGLEYSGLYFNNTLKKNRTVGADFYPYVSDLQNPQNDSVLANDQFGRLDANLAAKKQNTVTKGKNRSYNDAMIALVNTIHEKLGFAPQKDIAFVPELEKSFVYSFSSKYPNIIPIATTSTGEYPGIAGEFNPEILNILGRHTNLPSTVAGGKNYATLSTNSKANNEFLAKLLTDLSSLGCLKKTPSTPSTPKQFAYQIDIGKTNGLSFTGYGTTPNQWDMCYTVADDRGALQGINNTEFFRHSGPGIDSRGKTDSHCSSNKISDFVLLSPSQDRLINLSTKYKNNTATIQNVGIQINRCPNLSKGADNKIHCDDGVKLDENVSLNGGYIVVAELKAGEEMQAHWNDPAKNDFITITKNQNNKYISSCNIGKNAPLPLCQTLAKKIILNSNPSNPSSSQDINLSRKNTN